MFNEWNSTFGRTKPLASWYWTWWARLFYLLAIALFVWYEWKQYQQRMSLRRQLDQRLTALYAVENQQERVETKSETVEEQKSLQEAIPDAEEVTQESDVTKKDKVPNEKDKDFLDKLDHLILTNLLQTDLDVNFLAQCKLLCFF